MRLISCCPSTLGSGFSAYSPKGAKALFGGKKVCPVLDFDIKPVKDDAHAAETMRRISLSGVQEKYPAVVENGRIRLARDEEQSTHILKPAPGDMSLLNHRQIPANEHLTMQVASQVYGIRTAANGLCFTKSGQPVLIVRRFDVLPDGAKTTMEDFASVVECLLI